MKSFVGMDLGSKSVRYEIRDEIGRVRKRGMLDWSSEEWGLALSGPRVEDVTVAFETGPEAYRARTILDNLGIATYPFHAANFGSIRNAKKKTDRIDAAKICRAPRSEGLPERVVLPSDEEARLRNLITERAGYQSGLLRLVNRTKGLARQWVHALPRYSRSNFHPWWMETIEAFPIEGRPAVARLYRTALGVLQALDELEEEIRNQVETAGHSRRSRRLQTMPGVGPVVASVAVAYLGDGRRFASGRKFASYRGLIPSVSQTGEQEPRLGHITKQGPSALRFLFLQAANAAIGGRRLDRTKWKSWFRGVAKRRGRKIAIVALARKIAETCYAMTRDESDWEPSRLRSPESSRIRTPL